MVLTPPFQKQKDSPYAQKTTAHPPRLSSHHESWHSFLKGGDLFLSVQRVMRWYTNGRTTYWCGRLASTLLLLFLHPHHHILQLPSYFRVVLRVVRLSAVAQGKEAGGVQVVLF